MWLTLLIGTLRTWQWFANFFLATVAEWLQKKGRTVGYTDTSPIYNGVKHQIVSETNAVRSQKRGLEAKLLWCKLCLKILLTFILFTIFFNVTKQTIYPWQKACLFALLTITLLSVSDDLGEGGGVGGGGLRRELFGVTINRMMSAGPNHLWLIPILLI